MFALFEDDNTFIRETAGFAAFGSSTSGYGYSPSSRTLFELFSLLALASAKMDRVAAGLSFFVFLLWQAPKTGARGRLFGVTG